ncbi:ATP-dependent DNA helicase RecG [Sedimentisphaera salicampi]|uniref:ATP-dependent DNA helicase RecG n=2 Tax=Sedimentisphaera salicampi TaxID=1941349 RepID=A0A1W6LP09_9BACT|nr:ATP-dependent DNA helicase RecG [Sedimentisphaera salicampi]
MNLQAGCYSASGLFLFSSQRFAEIMGINLNTEIQMLKGVGPGKAPALQELGVCNGADLLEYFPRDWEFLPETAQISELTANANVCVCGVIESTDYHKFKRKPIFEIYLIDKTGALRIIWFNGGYLANQLHPGMRLAAYGKVTKYKHQLQMTNPRFKILREDIPEQDPKQLGGAVYPATASMSSGMLKYIVRKNIDELSACVKEYFTESFREEKNLLPRKEAFRLIHLPQEESHLSAAKRTLKYEELFLMQLGLAVRRYRMRNFAPSIAMKFSSQLDRRIRKRFPFFLTEDQDKAIEEIVSDMSEPKPMNRLLQGDVGSGKTVVAVYAALMAIANKAQVGIMAPTEILSRQHYQSISRFLEGSRVRTELVTGKMPASERKQLTEQISKGEVDIVIGTTALIQGGIDFHNLGLAVIDEQHKFGVEQRAKLRKDKAPHCLVMTATPIPRTMTMTVFGDLDVSVIKTAPPGRGKVTTKLVSPENRKKAMEYIRGLVKAGRQAFFVYPRIESGESDRNLKSAEEEFELLKTCVYPEFSVELLHGQMPQEQKKNVMERFRKGEVNILVSTVVIEVGVDVPNATVMVIENANNFGLAQLHQLRGRIGRGASDSFCFLFSESDNETAIKRLEVMQKSTDGFYIAEKDLEIRGPGELFSTRQHGLPDLKLANIVEDFEMLRMAKKDAEETLKEDPFLQSQENQNIKKAIIKKFGARLGLTDIA